MLSDSRTSNKYFSLHPYNDIINLITHVVVGWETPTLELMEGAAGVGVRVQAVKGDASLLPIQLRYSYMEATGSATSNVNELHPWPFNDFYLVF